MRVQPTPLRELKTKYFFGGVRLRQIYEVNIMTNNCESCEYYDFDEEYQEYICKIDMDEDEYLQCLTDKSRSCPYYKYYDEYKSVQKQN